MYLALYKDMGIICTKKDESEVKRKQKQRDLTIHQFSKGRYNVYTLFQYIDLIA